MTQPMSEEAMRAALRDIRLPSAAGTETVTDVLATLGFAGLSLLCLAGLLRLVTRARSRPRSPSLPEQVAALDKTAEPDRRIALLHLLKAQHSERFDALKDRLYRPDAPLGSDEIAAELLRD